MDYLEPFKKNPLREGENGMALCDEIYKLGAGAERVKTIPALQALILF